MPCFSFRFYIRGPFKFGDLLHLICWQEAVTCRGTTPHHVLKLSFLPSQKIFVLCCYIKSIVFQSLFSSKTFQMNLTILFIIYSFTNVLHFAERFGIFRALRRYLLVHDHSHATNDCDCYVYFLFRSWDASTYLFFVHFYNAYNKQNQSRNQSRKKSQNIFSQPFWIWVFMKNCIFVISVMLVWKQRGILSTFVTAGKRIVQVTWFSFPRTKVLLRYHKQRIFTLRS